LVSKDTQNNDDVHKKPLNIFYTAI